MQHRSFNAQARRGPGGAMMPGGPAGPTPAQIAAQQQAEHAAHIKQREDAKNRSRKPTNKNIPDGLEDVVIGDGVQQYKQLRDAERRLDAVMMRKRLDIQDSQPKGSKQYGTMRIWITNTVENQPWQSGAMDPHAFDFNSNVEATFKVKIEGRLLDAQSGEPEKEDEKDLQDGATDGERAAKRTKLSTPQNSRKRLSHFFKSISVDFDRPQAFQPDGYTQIKWTRPEYAVSAHADPPREADFDCLEFQRKADENINVTVNLVRDEQPERYKLSQPLAELLDMEEADRHTVLMGLWEYIKVAGLPMDEEQRRIQCDSKFREIFNVEHIMFYQIPELIKPYLLDLPPISLPYTIRCDKVFHAIKPPQPTIYDVRVPLPDTLRQQMGAIAASPLHTATLTAISRIDDRLALVMQVIQASKARHGFLTNLSKDPVNFTKRWISSQQRDLEVILGKGAWSEDEWQGAEWRKGGAGVWSSTEAHESVGSFLSRMKSG